MNERTLQRDGVLVEVRDHTRWGANPEAIADLVALVLRGEGVSAAEVGVGLVGEAAMRRLNREQRGVDAVTDVLSFPLEEPGEWESPLRSEPGVADLAAQEPPRLLGDVVLCPRQAVRQAMAEGTPPAFEVALLLAHGLLHLLGWEHQEWPGPMALRQGELLSGFDWTRLAGA